MPKLIVVPTPIGNLEDITLRAIRTLSEVDFVIAEDTRVSGFLLKHLNINKVLFSFHNQNEHKTLHTIIEKIKTSVSVALVSDAGTPAISDPGFLLVRECIANGIEIECLPGPTAFVPAIVNSGLPCDSFYFEGFLPQKKGRLSRLNYLAKLDCTFILYESPFRLIKTLEQLSEHLGSDRRASVSREISKLHEENKRGTLEELIKHFNAKTIKGEIVIIVEGNTKSLKISNE